MSLENSRPITCLISRGDIQDSNYAAKSRDLIHTIRTASKCGISWIQLREKRLSAGKLADLAREVLDLLGPAPVRILINDRADISVATGCHGVHLTSGSIPCNVVRRIVGNDFMVGMSAHTAEDIRRARDEGADYVLFGPIFNTPKKGPPVGLDVLRELCAANDLFPVIALGGIDASNYRATLDAGAAGFAAIRSTSDEKFLKDVVAKL